ncbi:hypothetical protein MMC30_006865 [Trapelia coarctata]|nr:hypothetical protein [Trapelia coarctata]
MSPEVAKVLNYSFIPIKIDREERPDIDSVYMNYVNATTGSGGWPLNVFLTPDLEPVFGGTYWPGPNSTSPMAAETASFLDIVEKLRDIWEMQEQKCRDSAKEITKQLKEFAEEGVHSHQLGEKSEGDGLEIELLEEAYQHFAKQYDKKNGGLGLPPKFPTPVKLTFLLRLGQWPEPVKHIVGEDDCTNAAAMAVDTLRKMGRGGIRDQIGFGFARYSVTIDWSLPHFEKMLYDQAQLLDTYLDAFLISHDCEMLGAVYDTATYLTTPPVAAAAGGFHSSEDADSYPSQSDKEKREGAYYVWTLKDFISVLGQRDAEICARFYGVTASGNVAPENDPHDEFMGQNVLKIASTPSALAKEFGMAEQEVIGILKGARIKLREYRERERPRPPLDDKVVVAWNGLAIGALARTSAVLEDVDPRKAGVYLAAAKHAVVFIKKELFDQESGQLWRIYREGRGDTPGFADDYAFLIQGLIELYQATFEEEYLEFADTLQKIQISLFHAPGGGFYTTPNPSSNTPNDLLFRLKDGMDSSKPSSNNISAMNLHRLASLLEDDAYARLARETVLAFEAEVEQWPFTFGGMLGSVVLGRLGVQGVVIAGTGEDGRDKKVLNKLRAELAPGRMVLRLKGVEGWLKQRNKLLAEMKVDGVTKVMVCEKGACREGKEFLDGL